MDGKDPTSGQTIDTVVLDVDGTLVDSVYLHVETWSQAFAEVDVDVSHARLHRAIGMGGDRLVAHVTDEETERAHGDRLRDVQKKAMQGLIGRTRPLAGAADLITELRRRRIRVVAASSGAPDQTRRLLDLAGGVHLFDKVVDADDVEESKPAPDATETAIERVDGGTAVIVGDSVWDVQAAQQQERPCVGLLSGGISEGELRAAGADWVFESPADLLAHLDDLPLSSA